MLEINSINGHHTISDQLELRAYHADAANVVLIDQPHILLGYIIKGQSFAVGLSDYAAGNPIALTPFEKMLGEIPSNYTNNKSPGFLGGVLFSGLFRNIQETAWRQPTNHVLAWNGRMLGYTFELTDNGSNSPITEGPYNGLVARDYSLNVLDNYSMEIASVNYDFNFRTWLIPNVGKPNPWTYLASVNGGMGTLQIIRRSENPGIAANYEGEDYEFYNLPDSLIENSVYAGRANQVQTILCLVKK